MNTNPADKSEQNVSPLTPGRRLSRRRIAVLVLLAFALGFGVYAMFGPTPRVPLGVLVATADSEEATGYRNDGDLSGDAVIAANATKLQSSHSVITTNAMSSSGGDRLFARTLAIYNLHDDLLMQRVELAVFGRLRDAGRFEQIRYLPAGERLPDGERLPEVFVTLDQKSWEVSGLPGDRQFKGEFVVTASDQLRRSRNSYSTNLSPPQVQYRWGAEIEYSAEQTGIETSGARYQEISRELAKEIADRLTKLLDEITSKHGVAGELPEQFYPEYREPPDFDFVSELNSEKMIDGPTLMSHTVVVWQIPDDRTPREVIATVSRSLADAGWKVPETEPDDEYLRATDGEQVVTVFRDSDNRVSADESADRARMFVVYGRDMPAGDIHAAVRKMFEDGADESALVMFQNIWHRHRELVEAYFADHAPIEADSWLQLARLRKSSAPEAAREALLRANALQRIVHQKTPNLSMNKLAEELGMEKLPQQISHEMMMILGLGELLGPGELKVTVRLNEPAPICLSDDEEEQSWLILTPVRRRGVHPEQTLQIQLLTFRQGGWSLSNQTGGDLTSTARPVHTEHLGGGEEVQVFAEPTPGGRYRLSLRRNEIASAHNART